jgi:drug/metabolite transporter (DMT)-like permease
MLYIILATITSVLMLVIVRLFQKFEAHTFYALIANYISAFVCGISYTSFMLKQKNITLLQTIFSLHSNVWILTIIEGFLFITVFYWIAQTTRFFGMAVASVANKMSLVFPVISAAVLFNEHLDLIRWTGLSMAVVSVYLVTYSEQLKSSFKNSKNIIFPLLVFIGSGVIDSLINYGNKTFIDTTDKQFVFSTFVYLFALITGIIYLIFDNKKIFYVEKFNWRSTIILGTVLGIPNFFNLYFIIEALNTHIFPSGQIFLILNLSNVIVSSLIGISFFKEKLNWINWTGILFAIAAIYLVK